METYRKAPAAECTDFINRLHQKGVKLWLDSGMINYQARKGIMTAEDKATLQAMKDDIVGVLSRWKSFKVAQFPSEKQESASLVSLTAQQEVFWNALQQGATSYLIPFALRISGPLKVEMLRQSFEELIDRHDALRTRVVLVDGMPKQKIERSGCSNFGVVDLSELVEEEVSAGVHRVVEDVMNQGCDIENEPLFDVRLIKLRERSHLLVWSMHHIISDAYTNIVLFRELWLLYGELSQGRPSPLQSIPMHYAHYALWQEEERRVWPEKHESYWKERLAAATSIQWPTESHESATVLDGHVVRIAFGSELSGKLRDLAAASGATLGMVVLVLYAVVVSQWCNQKDFVFATTATGRDRSELETMAGYCSHLLYLRVQLIGSESFIDFLNIVSQEYYGGLLHQGFFATRHFIDLSPDTFFQWLPWQPVEFGGVPRPHESAKLDVVVEPYPVKASPKNAPFSSYANMVTVWDSNEGIAGIVKGAASESSVERVAQKFRLVAEQVVTNPYGRVVSFPVK